ncbi:MAG TPA: L,D-transpeptidase [Chloroflexota bacterium]|nr:L,D-transpeptidase [Chloroflexota bacterium]
MRWLQLVVALGLVGLLPLGAAGQELAPGAADETGHGAPSEEPALTSPAPPDAVPTDAETEEPRWVATHRPTELWSDSDGGVSFGPIRQWSYLQLTGQAADGRLYVFNPRTNNYAWVDADAVGPVPPPPATYLTGPEVLATIMKPGRVVGNFNLRSWPAVQDETFLRQLPHNTPLFVYEAVRGEDGETWYRVGEDEYVHATGVRLPKPPPRTFPGRWIDVDLSEPAMIAAYEGDQLVYAALTIKGTAVDPTPTGVYRIIRRVANETMDSATIGIPRNSPRGYYLRNVLYTQYFTPSGASIHYNYWSSVFGYAGSHGCLGLNLADAEWFWNWAEIGTVLHIHY